MQLPPGSRKRLDCLTHVQRNNFQKHACRRQVIGLRAQVMTTTPYSLNLLISLPPHRVMSFDTPQSTKYARLASNPSMAGRNRRRRQRQLLRSVVAGSGTVLRSLCWLLLHRRRGVSEGAAAVLLALTDPTPAGTAGPRPAPPWAVLGLVEQGCVPILRMAAGTPAVPPSPKLGREGRVTAATASPAQEAVGGADADPGGCGGSAARRAAGVVLETVVDEACVRHVERLVRSVSVSGNRELRANVALAVGILSTGAGRGRGQGGGKVYLLLATAPLSADALN